MDLLIGNPYRSIAPEESITRETGSPHFIRFSMCVRVNNFSFKRPDLLDPGMNLTPELMAINEVNELRGRARPQRNEFLLFLYTVYVRVLRRYVE